MSDERVKPCSWGARHWFTLRGYVGVRRPDCDRCGVANPRPLTEDEQETFDYFATPRALADTQRTDTKQETTP